ncbi:IS6 family transposase [Tritonibacter scottomollicae]|uniref:IS6 family transposase n=1 Tax=Tritonibacter scottomollicae TaxID=483013 RepID=UPI003AA99D00
MLTQKISYKRHRFPPQIIAHVVWLYARSNLSLREVEELMLERGVDVSYETIRSWTVKFGPLIAHALRRRQPRPGDVWHLDEVVVKIASQSYWLWRAVDQHVVVLEEILPPRRDKRAAKRVLIKLMKRWSFVPKRIITDKLRSYGADLLINEKGWQDYILRHELIHHWRNEQFGAVQGSRLPRWYIEGMAYSVSQDLRDPLPRTDIQAWRAQFNAWVQEGNEWRQPPQG